MGRPTVLIVDDDGSIRRFAETMLTGAGYETRTAASGANALRMMDAHGEFDTFIIDVVMPQMLGTELGERIRQRYPSAKLLYFTGDPGWLSDQQEGRWQPGAFLAKPTTRTRLLETVSLLIFGHPHGLPNAES